MLGKLLKSRIALILVLVGLGWVAFLLTKVTINKNLVAKELDELKSEISKLESRQSQLSNLSQYFQSESFIEKEARQKLNLQKPGEEVVFLVSGEEGATVPGLSTPESTHQLDLTPDEPTNPKKWFTYIFGAN